VDLVLLKIKKQIVYIYDIKITECRT
jgi:hypothetical protein